MLYTINTILFDNFKMCCKIYRVNICKYQVSVMKSHIKHANLCSHDPLDLVVFVDVDLDVGYFQFLPPAFPFFLEKRPAPCRSEFNLVEVVKGVTVIGHHCIWCSITNAMDSPTHDDYVVVGPEDCSDESHFVKERDTPRSAALETSVPLALRLSEMKVGEDDRVQIQKEDGTWSRSMGLDDDDDPPVEQIYSSQGWLSTPGMIDETGDIDPEIIKSLFPDVDTPQTKTFQPPLEPSRLFSLPAAFEKDMDRVSVDDACAQKSEYECETYELLGKQLLKPKLRLKWDSSIIVDPIQGRSLVRPRILPLRIKLMKYPISIINAIREGDLELIIRAHECGSQRPANGCDIAAQQGHLETLNYLIEEGYEITGNTFKCAAKHGDVAIMEYLLSKKCPISHRAAESAAKRGNIEALAFIMKNKLPWDLVNCMVFGTKECADFILEATKHAPETYDTPEIIPVPLFDELVKKYVDKRSFDELVD